ACGILPWPSRRKLRFRAAARRAAMRASSAARTISGERERRVRLALPRRLSDAVAPLRSRIGRSRSAAAGALAARAAAGLAGGLARAALARAGLARAFLAGAAPARRGLAGGALAGRALAAGLLARAGLAARGGAFAATA